MSERYVVVVPVKPPAFGKSRLQGLDDATRRELAAAFATDTVTACLAARRVAQVLVATDDAAFAATLTAHGCTAVPDGDTSDLNGALRQAVAEAHRRWPDLVPVAVLADLPALLPTDLDAALDALVPGGASYVGDADGTGTTLYTAPYDEFDPRFGPDSRAVHTLAGALEVRGELVTLRRDVDDLDALREAAALGLGPTTAALWAVLETSPARWANPPMPDRLDATHLSLTPLCPDVVDLDVEAYTSSPGVIAVHSDGRWEVEGFSRDDDLVLLEQHAAMHRDGTSFAYLALEPGGARALGCVYLNPLDDYLGRVGAVVGDLGLGLPTGSAMLTFWVREDEQDGVLPGRLVAAVRRWLETAWTLPAYVVRVLPAETRSVAALEAAGLRSAAPKLGRETRPYRWFAPG